MISNKKLLLCMTGTVLALASSWSFAQVTIDFSQITISLEARSPKVHSTITPTLTYRVTCPSDTTNIPACENNNNKAISSNQETTINVPTGSKIAIEITKREKISKFSFNVSNIQQPKPGSISCKTHYNKETTCATSGTVTLNTQQ